MKRALYLTLAVLSAVLSFAGCSDTNIKERINDKPTSYKSSGSITISIIHYLSEKPKIQALKNMVDAFMDENSNINIDIQSMSLDQYANVLKLKLAAGDSPNIMFGNPKSYLEIVNAGNVLDLSEQSFVKRIVPQFISNVKIDGRIYGVPLDLMSSGVFYNKDIFEKEGISIPNTWDGFLNICKKLKSKGITPIAAGYKDRASIGGACYTEIYGTPLSKMPDFREQVMTGNKKLADFPEFKAFLERFSERNKYVNSDALQIGIDRAEQLFASGKTAMIVLGSWGVSAIRNYNLNGNFGVFMFPSSNDGIDLMSTATDDTWMISSRAENQEISLKYFDYMTSQKAASKWADDVKVISAINDVKASNLDPMTRDLQKIYESGRIENWLESQDFYGQFLDIWMMKLMELTYNQGTNLDQFIKKWDTEIEKARETNKN